MNAVSAPHPPRFYGLDASIYIFQAWFGRDARFSSAEGCPLNAVEGYLMSLLSMLDGLRPRCFVAAFDDSLGRGFREERYPPYKASRALPDAVLAYQLVACRKITEALGVYCWSSTRFEADDLLATAASILRRDGRSVTLLTRDKDLGQILQGDKDALLHWGQAPRYRAEVQQHLGVLCEQLPDYLALVGDRVDDIPGVSGIGPVAAKALLARHRDLDDIFAHIDQLSTLDCHGAGTLSKKLTLQRDDVFLFRELCRLREDVPLPADWRDGVYAGADWQTFRSAGLDIGFPQSWLDSIAQRYPWVFATASGESSRHGGAYHSVRTAR